MNRHKEAGLTLVELLVSMALLLVLLVPLLSFMRAGQLARSTTVRLADVEQNARAALQSIGRDIQNAGYNFAPSIPVGSSAFLDPLTGPPIPAPAPSAYNISPILPGNNINLVRTVDSNGATVTNRTDQITMIFVDQSFNEGRPLSGNLIDNGRKFRVFTGGGPLPAASAELFRGSFAVLSIGGEFAIGVVTDNNLAGDISFEMDTYGINQPGTGRLFNVSRNPQVAGQVSLYKFFFVSYYVDGNGNLIRREQLPPPHTQSGGSPSMAAVALTPNRDTYDCKFGTCFYDSIIATGVEDLQFSYYLFIPDTTVTNIAGPVEDPSFYGRATNGGGTTQPYRLLDIRQVNVSIRVRASERDVKVHDQYNPALGYLYRFSLDATFNTRNFYGSDFRPN
ncbi:MAG: prepilin-type N-terminal cleavage/methylation domain-containing protein [Blastocatellia bacterium]|nr:prepilin-type N-terminal cleavage/methylation domain-containing protein [Blastocatellia bacterium]